MKFGFSSAFACVLIISFLSAPAIAQRGGGRSNDDGWKFLSGKYDKNKDGKIELSEYSRGKEAFEKIDRNSDGSITADDWKVRSKASSPAAGTTAPVVGSVAPDFSLSQVQDSSKSVKLSSFTGKKPVALIFGSCT
jgi:Ca2+-binding EF-hand superfamily protein